MKNFPAHVDMVRIEFLESRNSEKLWEALEELLEQYSEMPRRRKILGEIVCYYLFVNYDLVEACFYMRKLIQMNSSSFDVISVSTFVKTIINICTSEVSPFFVHNNSYSANDSNDDDQRTYGAFVTVNVRIFSSLNV